MKIRAQEVIDEGDSEKITAETAKEIGKAIGVDWNKVKFTPGDLAAGMKVELEHGTKNPDTNITEDDAEMTAKIALAHLNESEKYYELLAEMEKKF